MGLSGLADWFIGDFEFVFIGYFIDKSSEHSLRVWIYPYFVWDLSKVPKNSIRAFLLTPTG